MGGGAPKKASKQKGTEAGGLRGYSDIEIAPLEVFFFSPHNRGSFLINLHLWVRHQKKKKPEY